MRFSLVHTTLPGEEPAGKREQQGRKQEVIRNKHIAKSDVFEAYETALKEKLEDAYDVSYLEALKDDLLGFTHVTVREMLSHLEEQCLALTTTDKKQKLRQIELNWTPGDDI